MAVTAQKHSRGPGQAGRRRCRRSQRRLTPPPKAAGSPRARTPRQAQPGRSGAPQRARPSRGGGVPAIRNPRSRLPDPADPSLAGRPGEAALHRRRRSPGGNSSHSGTDSSSSPRRPRARATHSRPRSRAPKVPPLARPAPSSPLVPRPFESSPALAIGRGPVARPASPPGLSRPPRLRAARARAFGSRPPAERSVRRRRRRRPVLSPPALGTSVPSGASGPRSQPGHDRSLRAPRLA